MSELTCQKYLKGFKIDRKKLEKLGFHPTKDDPHNMRYFKPIIHLIARNSYKYISTGFEDGGHKCLIIVMEEDKDVLQKMDMPFCDESLLQASRNVLTAGVWPSWD
jgi:hypothetical protein